MILILHLATDNLTMLYSATSNTVHSDLQKTLKNNMC